MKRTGLTTPKYSWHFDNDATSKIHDVLTEHVGPLQVLPLTVHLNCFSSEK